MEKSNNVSAKKDSSSSKKDVKFADQLNELLNELEEKDLSALPDDEILKMRKKLNPYGRTIEGSDKFLNFSLTQIHHEYHKKLIITAMVGYLNRMNDEWKVPEGVPVVPVYEYLEDKSKCDTPELTIKKGDKSSIYDYEFNRKWMEKRIIVKEFLEEMFQFNPDEHVRSGYRPNRGDKERKPINTPAGNLAVEHLLKTDKEFRAKEELFKDVENIMNETKKTKTVTKTVVGKDGKKKTITKEVPIDQDVDDKNEKAAVAAKTRVTKKLDEKKDAKDPTVKNTVREMIPPHDIFGRFKIYLQSNYEELRDAVKDLYCEKPELELAINPYAWHDTEEEAEAFKKKHSKEVIAEIFTAHSGKWNFFDSFKEQRESVNFYNDNTIILEEMVKQLEKDEKLGQDLMKKRVEKIKKKNVVESGPDAESFKKWRQQNNELSKMGASHIGDMVDENCPDDAIEVPIWRIGKGGTEISRDKFYSLAEAPTFMTEEKDKQVINGGLAAAPVNSASQPTPQPAVKSRTNNL